MNDQALQIVLWIGGIGLAVIGTLAGALITITLRNLNGTSERGERDTRDVARRTERNQDRQVETAIDLSKLEANVNVLMTGSSKCDELASKVAVLEDFKARAEAKLDEVDEASRELRGMSEQMKTVFNKFEGLSEEIGNKVAASVIAKIPQVVRDTLEAARAMPQQRAS